MKNKARQAMEMCVVLIAIILITSLTPFFVSLGTNLPEKMFFTLLPYILMVGLVVAVSKIGKRPLHLALGINKIHFSKQLLISFGVFLVTFVIFVAMPLVIGMSKSDVLSFKSTNPVSIVFYIFYYLFFVGIGEEIIWRGYFYERLKDLTNSGVLVVIISSVLFGLWHYPLGQNILQVLMTSIIGLILGFSRLKIRDCSTLSVGIAHGLHDTFIFILSCIFL